MSWSDSVRRKFDNHDLFKLFFLFTVAALGVLIGTGCQNPFEPAAEMGIISFSPNPLQPESGGTDGEAKLPLSDLDVRIFNGVPVSIDGYRVTYTGPDGNEITSPSLAQSGKMTLYVKPATATADSQVTEDVTVSLRVLTQDVYTYAINGTTYEVADDISPITATVTLYGVDDNRNTSMATCHIPIDSRTKE